jgi:aminomethyltransferase
VALFYELIMSEAKQIPLHDFHARQGARFVDFAGWSMPVQYTSIIQEHLAVRHAVGLFDVSHMGELMLGGADALPFLNYLCTNDFTHLGIGQSRYTMMCYENGGVVDDLIVYRLSEEAYLLCVNASNCDKDFTWAKEQSRKFDVSLENQSAMWALLALQGPKSEELLCSCLKTDSANLDRFHHANANLCGIDVVLSRTGYTGEDGYEIYIPVSQACEVAEALASSAQTLKLEHFFCGLGCRDSLRLEAGYPLYGHEISTSIDPISAQLGWTVKLDKAGDFIGKEALAAIKAEKSQRVVKFFTLDDRRIARQGEAVWSGESQVGEVLSGGYSPVLETAMGSCLIDRSALKAGDPLEVRLRGRSIALELKRPPLHKAG